MVNTHAWQEITSELTSFGVTLIAVSKTKPASDIEALYALGQRDFGENYVQELVDKQAVLPADIRWHFIGHLQSNKVKYIAPFVYLIHGVDSHSLLAEINKQAKKHNRIIPVLLQVFIATEESKFGLDEQEVLQIVRDVTTQPDSYSNVRIVGLMGMASNTENEQQVKTEFAKLQALLADLNRSFLSADNQLTICSMGMSGDYKLAIEQGSTMVRIGSLLFGARTYPNA